MTPHIYFAKSGPSPSWCIFRGSLVTLSRKSRAYLLALSLLLPHRSKPFPNPSIFTHALSHQLFLSWNHLGFLIYKMTGVLSNYGFHEIFLFFFRCESGYTGQHCEKTDFSILYVVPSRQKLTHVLIAAIIGAVQIAIIVAIVMCITR